MTEPCSQQSLEDRRITEDNLPSVSVVVPLYGKSTDLAKRCIDSLTTLDFPRERHEVILVCDGKFADELRGLYPSDLIRIASSHEVGSGPAKNKGIGLARFPIVAFIDADCEPEVNWLRALIKPMMNDPGILGVVGTTVTDFSDFYPPLRTTTIYLGGSRLKAPTCNVAYRRDALLKVGLFDPNLYRAEDYDLMLKVSQLGKIVFNPEARVLHHLHRLSLGGFLVRTRWAAYAVLLHKRHRRWTREYFGCIGPITRESQIWIISVAAFAVPIALGFPVLGLVVASCGYLAGILRYMLSRKKTVEQAGARLNRLDIELRRAAYCSILTWVEYGAHFFWRLYGSAKYRSLLV